MDSLLLPVLVLVVLFRPGAASPSEDLEILISFKSSLPDPHALPSWMPTRNPCFSFAGVSCKSSRVAAVALDRLPLSTDLRSVASTLFALEYLESLSLTFANLTGTLASAGGSRCSSRLTVVDLAGNRLVGSVANVSALATSCSGLRSLNLSSNAVGPSAAGNAPSGAGFHVQTLDLSFNEISGETDLRWLLSGSDIHHLDLAGNQLSGVIPTIPDCSVLYHLDLSFNHLSGEIGVGIFSECRNLVFLSLSSNYFSGSFPSDLSSCSSLESISLSANNFSGELPLEALTSMPSLRRVELAFNMLEFLIKWASIDSDWFFNLIEKSYTG